MMELGILLSLSERHDMQDRKEKIEGHSNVCTRQHLSKSLFMYCTLELYR